LLQKAHNESLILKTPEGNEFFLAEIDEFSREVELTHKNEELMAFLEQRAQQSQTVSFEDAKVMLGLE
jgi:hypothetical protein